MVTPILNEIGSQYLDLNSQTFQKGFYTARQYQDGRVVIYNVKGEGEYSGLSDLNCNFFYIRHGDTAIGFATADDTNRLTSCVNYTVTAPARIVLWVFSGDIDTMIDTTVNDLITMDLEDVDGFDRIQPIEVTSVLMDPEEIFKQETLLPEERVKLPKGITIVAIDFNVIYTMKAETDTDCITRNFCIDAC